MEISEGSLAREVYVDDLLAICMLISLGPVHVGQGAGDAPESGDFASRITATLASLRSLVASARTGLQLRLGSAPTLASASASAGSGHACLRCGSLTAPPATRGPDSVVSGSRGPVFAVWDPFVRRCLTAGLTGSCWSARAERAAVT